MSQELTIEAGHAERQYWKDLWRYRELFLILTWRDVAVQYKQTVVGILWAVLRPLLTMAAFTIVFSKIAKLPAEGEAPYALMVFAAMLPWQLFATSLAATANSLVANSNLVSKVYFPRVITTGRLGGLGAWSYPLRSQCDLPGFPHHCPLYYTVWSVYFASWFFLQYRPGKMASAL